MYQQTCYQQNIMIVKDDSALINNVQELLKNNGFEVIIANNCRKCLFELEKGFHGIIIIDLKTSIFNGIEIIRKIRDEGFINQNIILMLTPKCILGEEFEEIYPYIHDLIFKPLDVHILLKTIKKITHRSH